MFRLLYINWEVNPIMFHIGPIPIRWYSMMFFVSFALGLYIFAKMVRSEGKPAVLSDNIIFPVFFGTLFGARIGHCLFYQPDYFLKHPLEILIPFHDGKFTGYEGLASHGAAIGILLALYWFSRKYKVAYFWTLDRIVITVALSGFFIRVGNLMNSEIYGHITNLPWGFVFLQNGETEPKHPSQIYEALAYLAVFAILYAVYLKKKPPFKDGIIFGLFLIMLFGARFFIEFLKEIQVGFEANMALDMGQILSLPLISAGIIIIWQVGKNGLTAADAKTRKAKSKS